MIVFFHGIPFVDGDDQSLAAFMCDTGNFRILLGIWVETIAYVICAVLIFFFTIEKDLTEEQKAIAARKNK